MPGDEITDEGFLFRIFQFFQIDHLKITPLRKITLDVDHVCDPTTHARCKVSAGAAQDNDTSTGHVFAAMIADTFNNGDGTAVSNGEPFSGHTAYERFSRRCAIECDVADDDVFFRFECS